MATAKRSRKGDNVIGDRPTAARVRVAIKEYDAGGYKRSKAFTVHGATFDAVREAVHKALRGAFAALAWAVITTPALAQEPVLLAPLELAPPAGDVATMAPRPGSLQVRPRVPTLGQRAEPTLRFNVYGAGGKRTSYGVLRPDGSSSAYTTGGRRILSGRVR